MEQEQASGEAPQTAPTDEQPTVPTVLEQLMAGDLTEEEVIAYMYELDDGA